MWVDFKFKILFPFSKVFFHGEADELINISHGKTIHEKLGNRALKPSWLIGIGHNDILGEIDLMEVAEVINLK